MTRAAKHHDARRYEVAYYPPGRGWGRHIAKGFGDNLINLRGRVAWHLAKGDYYQRAIIFDRREGRAVVKLWLTEAGNIHIQQEG